MTHDPSGAPLPCRVIVDPPADGPLQMAVDEVLLESAAEQGICSLRFYGWSQPTLSLGYFQSYGDRASTPPAWRVLASAGKPAAARSCTIAS